MKCPLRCVTLFQICTELPGIWWRRLWSCDAMLQSFNSRKKTTKKKSNNGQCQQFLQCRLTKFVVFPATGGPRMWSNVCALASAASFNADGKSFEFFSNIIMLRMLFLIHFFLKRGGGKKKDNSRWNYHLRCIVASRQTEVVPANGWIKFCQSIYVCVSETTVSNCLTLPKPIIM